MTKDIAALIAGATLPERTVDVCFAGQLQAELDGLNRQLREMGAVPSSRGDDFEAGPDPRTELQQRIADIEQQMRDNTAVFRLRALPRPVYQALVDKHPPRKDNDRDRGSLFNIDTFYPALIRACVIEPAVTDEQWAVLFAQVLSEHYFNKLGLTALAVNSQGVDVPFSRGGSPTSPNSAAASK